MRSIILCEGFDEILIIGYYLYKTKDGYIRKMDLFRNYIVFPNFIREIS